MTTGKRRVPEDVMRGLLPHLLPADAVATRMLEFLEEGKSGTITLNISHGQIQSADIRDHIGIVRRSKETPS